MPSDIALINFEFRIASAAERPVLFRMLELYQHDRSDVWDQDIDEHGEYGYSLDRYWSDSDHRPYVILVESKFAGLALVNGEVKVPGGRYWLEQYFIIKKYRRRGLGSAAATRLFNSLPGQWQVGQMPLNLPAQAFLRVTINGYTNGNYRESEIKSGSWRGVLQEFSSPSTDA